VPCIQASKPARGRQQVVQRHRKPKAILGGEKRVDIHHADLGDRRVLDFSDQAGDVEAAPFFPGVVEEARYQDVFATGNRVGIHAEQREYAGRCCLYPFAVLRCSERMQHGYGQP
jgi:hypothetical protein